jgi:acyl-homoserine lactone synthase
MVEIHVVRHDNANLYQRELESYFRWRHLIYVEERGWEDLRKSDQLERDQFDTEAAVHLLALENGELVGASRLIPACHPTILSDVFPHLVERGEVPRGRDTLDWTRMFVVPSRRVGRRKHTVRGALFTAVMEYALLAGARQVGGVIETFWLPHFAAIGWHCHVLGMPQSIADSWTVAAFVTVDADALQKVRSCTGWAGPVLVGIEQLDRRVA